MIFSMVVGNHKDLGKLIKQQGCGQALKVAAKSAQVKNHPGQSTEDQLSQITQTGLQSYSSEETCAVFGLGRL